MFTRTKEPEDERLIRRSCNRPSVVAAIGSQFSLIDGILHRQRGHECCASPVVGFKVGPYRFTKVAGSVVPVHNVIAILSTGKLIPSGMACDHIDGNPMNNHASNIRVVTNQVNSHNTKTKAAATGRANISKTKWGTYRVSHVVSGQMVRVGTFKTMDAAIAARNESFALYAPEKLASIRRRGERQ